MAKKKATETATSTGTETAAKAAETPAKGQPPKQEAAKTAPTRPAEAKAAEPAPKEAETKTTVEPARAKKKGRPGQAPPLGKKKRNERKQLQEKIRQLEPMSLRAAVEFLKQHRRAKFDETVEVHLRLNVDPRQSDQVVRGAVSLPHGIGKPVRVLVFAAGENAQRAQQAGADYVGADDLAKKIQSGWFEFDVALAMQDMMGLVGRLGKLLGPRGLMPSPKTGTVVTGDIAQAVREYKMGKVEFRVDQTGNVHAPVGKLSFDTEKLVENVQAFLEAVRAARPAAVRGQYIKSVTLSSTMGPGIRIAL
ncbi:MAG: 50S ribosomal protein L1 [Gemmatales bacterium]|nr:50S ribosomal protein L1 [Gemmatales bacterium]MDW7995897.1 50S ribosomal protein L1 [Gemmatales bacterium]